MPKQDPPAEVNTTVNQNAALVLVVDDEPSICWAFERMLGEQGHEVLTASSSEAGLEIAVDRKPDLVLLDVRLPKEDGITALPKFKQATGGSPVVVMTAFGDLETAVAAVKAGAEEYLIKPFALAEARRVCESALRSLADAAITHAASTPENNKVRAHRNDKIVGQSPAIQHAFRQIALVADSDLSVLITGETGTGKELVAAAIHRHSNRSKAVYLPISPVALNEDLIESELFGHVKGAFTGATDDRMGLFEKAEGGTVLLDEIGELPLNIQAKLLRVLEQGEYCRVGDVTTRHCNVRIIAATNCDLHNAVQSKTFREDLYYRLNGLHIHLPPLRSRPEDIKLLCSHFLSSLNSEAAKSTAINCQISDALAAELAKRPWHGNIRELRNAVEHAAVIARGRNLAIEDFPKVQPSTTNDSAPSVEPFEKSISRWIEERLSEPDATDLQLALNTAIEPILIRMVLQQTGDNRAKAAEVLGIHRGTLREKMRLYNL